MSSQSSALFPLRNASYSSSFQGVFLLCSSSVMVKPQGNDRAYYIQKKIILKSNSMPKPRLILLYMLNMLFLLLTTN